MTPDKKIADEAKQRRTDVPEYEWGFIDGASWMNDLTRSEYEEKIKALEGRVKELERLILHGYQKAHYDGGNGADPQELWNEFKKKYHL